MNRPGGIILAVIVWLGFGQTALPSTVLTEQDFPFLIDVEIIDGELQKTFAEAQRFLVEHPTDWEEQVADPLFQTEDEVWQGIERFRTLNDYALIMLNSLPTLEEKGTQAKGLIECYQKLYDLTAIFLLMTEDDDCSQLHLISFSADPDSALCLLREGIGLTAPRGYAYVRAYQGTADLPNVFKPLFKDPNTKGVTFLSRYVVILDYSSELQTENLPRPLPTTFSHELVHAFVNAKLGFGHKDALPLWFHEGIAIYLSHSGDLHVHNTYDPWTQTTTTYIQGSPADYALYRDVFVYCEKTLDRSSLLYALRQVIEEKSTAPLLKAMQVESADQIVGMINQEIELTKQKNMRDGLVIIGLLMLIAIIDLIVWLRRN